MIYPTTSKRWYVKVSDSSRPMKLYMPDEESIKKLFKDEIVSITLCEDYEYIKYIELLIEKSVLITVQKNREWYQYPYGAGFLRFILSKDKNGGYYDLIKYQEWQTGRFMEPITFTLGNPRDFYLSYFSDKEINNALPDQYISPRELKKTKAKLFNRKNGEKCWVDSDGYFYSADNYFYTNKANKEEYQKFHDNPNAVLVKEWGGLYHNSSCNWWLSLSEFEEHFEQVKAETPSYSQTPTYEIKRFGYTKPHPDDRLTVYRYPYFNIDRELEHGKTPIQIAISWNKMCNDKYVAYDYYPEIEKMIKEYIKWKEKG